jgi:c-di-GMP-binding flagellar brake protein YcgR
MEEARRHERVRVDRRVRLRTPAGVEANARMVNLSLGGAGLVYGAPAAVGTPVELGFELPIRGEPRPFLLKAVVRYSHLASDGHRVGVEFLELPREDLRALFTFVLQTKYVRR